MKSVQIQSFFCSVFPVSGLSPNTEKYGPEKTPYLNIFRAVTDSEAVKKTTMRESHDGLNKKLGHRKK